ncbi:transporter [Mesorhizobium sp. Z1-4]|uniref:transporter n=1 Tax=Mesorhizobium sp. Z1-4 TaxID=2448478 RepID=UPI000FDA9A49|nr:transporter [Mesorhizobium sp. Z1-4]
MPSADDIQNYLGGVWKLMNGRSEGLRQLDLSIDGFWNSFFAIFVALPALGVGWVSFANELAGGDPFAYRLWILAKLAVIDLISWVGPIILFAAVAKPVGLIDRFVPYVVASNWASAAFAWLLLPPALIDLFWPESVELTDLISLVAVILTLVLAWRLTNTVIARGAAVATAVFFAMIAVSVTILLVLQPLLGLAIA